MPCEVPSCLEMAAPAPESRGRRSLVLQMERLRSAHEEEEWGRHSKHLPRLSWSVVKGELGTKLGSCFGRGKLLRDQEF